MILKLTFRGGAYIYLRLAMVLTGPEPAAATAPGKLRRVKMKLTTLLKNILILEEITDVDSTVNREVYTIWVL